MALAPYWAFSPQKIHLNQIWLRDHNFERGFVEVASHKIRTKSRRLVPLHDALRAWLLPFKQESGPITDYAAPGASVARALLGSGVALKDNGFRHSYISYRVAQINDTARVALECGNSPEIIFQHYREIVGPDEAAAWFATIPSSLAHKRAA